MKRITLGVGAALLVGVLTSIENPATAEVVGDFSTFQFWTTLDISGKMLVAWYIGGLVAQRSFVLPVMIFSVVASGGVIWVMSRIFPDADVFLLVRGSAVQLVVGVVAAAFGALLGQRCYLLLRNQGTC